MNKEKSHSLILKDTLQRLKGYHYSSGGRIKLVPIPVLLNQLTRQQSRPVLDFLLSEHELNARVHEAKIRVYFRGTTHHFSIFLRNHKKQKANKSVRKVFRHRFRGDLIVMRQGRDNQWVHTRGNDAGLADYVVYK